jgi:hypothetical protein
MSWNTNRWWQRYQQPVSPTPPVVPPPTHVLVGAAQAAVAKATKSTAIAAASIEQDSSASPGNSWSRWETAAWNDGSSWCRWEAASWDEASAWETAPTAGSSPSRWEVALDYTNAWGEGAAWDLFSFAWENADTEGWRQAAAWNEAEQENASSSSSKDLLRPKLPCATPMQEDAAAQQQAAADQAATEEQDGGVAAAGDTVRCCGCGCGWRYRLTDGGVACEALLAAEDAKFLELDADEAAALAMLSFVNEAAEAAELAKEEEALTKRRCY